MTDTLDEIERLAKTIRGLEIRYHNAMPGWAKLIGLRIKAVPECEGGGFAVDREQAEAIRALAARVRELEAENADLKTLMADCERDSESVIRATGEIVVGLKALLREASPDDIREQGWAVAIHNDYKQNGRSYTFWLFTKNGHAVKGEGRTDAEALNTVREMLARIDAATGAGKETE